MLISLPVKANNGPFFMGEDVLPLLDKLLLGKDIGISDYWIVRADV